MDLTRVKSTRACLPLGRRVRARPGRRARISRRLVSWMAPCLRAWHPSGNWTLRTSTGGSLAGSSGSAKNQGPSPRRRAGGPCVDRPWPGSSSSSTTIKIWSADRPNQTARSVPLAGFGPRQIQPRLPAPGQARSRPPGQARLDTNRPGKRITPCPAACAFGQSDPANLHRRFAFRVLWQRHYLKKRLIPPKYPGKIKGRPPVPQWAAPCPLRRWPGSSGSRTTARPRSAQPPPARSQPRGYGRWPGHT